MGKKILFAIVILCAIVIVLCAYGWVPEHTEKNCPEKVQNISAESDIDSDSEYILVFSGEAVIEGLYLKIDMAGGQKWDTEDGSILVTSDYRNTLVVWRKSDNGYKKEWVSGGAVMLRETYEETFGKK